MIRPGKMIHTFLIQDPGATQEADGGGAQAWPTVDTRYGSLQTLGAEERVVSERDEAAATHRIRCRWASTVEVTRRHRIQHTRRGVTKFYKIFSVDNVDDADEELIILCKEDRT